MITDDLIKKEFITRVVNRDIRFIYKTQEAVVRENFPDGSGALASHLSRQPFTFSSGDASQTFFVRVFPYLRFLDIRYRRQQMGLRRKLALYNRVVYGVLYNETLPALRYGLTADIHKGIGEDLMAANPNTNNI